LKIATLACWSVSIPALSSAPIRRPSAELQNALDVIEDV
jgi:hypothetical protein